MLVTRAKKRKKRVHRVLSLALSLFRWVRDSAEEAAKEVNFFEETEVGNAGKLISRGLSYSQGLASGQQYFVFDDDQDHDGG